MLKPTKEAFLKHSLYKFDMSDVLGEVYPFEEIPKAKYKKIANKGTRFVYCECKRIGGDGWFADAGTGYLRPGNCGFNKMSNDWAEENLTEPVELIGTTWHNHWENMFKEEEGDD
jgi:hypothetical protein